jgi:predicted nucleic acid-binding protein
MVVNAFLDTSVLVDILRVYPSVSVWLKTQIHITFCITPLTWMEVLLGSQNMTAQRTALRFLTQFEMIYPIEADMDWAMQQLTEYRLSHNVGIMDCLIAAPCHRLQSTLYTRNLKHFTPMLGSLVQQPYT